MRTRARKHPPAVAFLGLFGVGNFGNEASLRAARLAFAEFAPGVQQVCVCADPARVEAEHAIPSYSIRTARRAAQSTAGGKLRRAAARLAGVPADWWYAIRLLRRVDAVIVPGTGILDDFGVRPWQMPYDLFRWALCSRLARTPMVFLSVGAGPIEGRLNRWLMLGAARLARHRSYRDQTSLRFMTSHGFRAATDPVYPDLAFSLPRPAVAKDSPQVTIGLGVMNYHGWTGRGPDAGEIHATYIARLATLCSLLVESGFRVRLLKGEDDDAHAVNELLALLAPGLRHESVVAPPMDTMAEVLDAIAGTDIVVATRFHNVVAALMLARPVVSLGYAAKNQDLLDCMGLAGNSSPAEDFDPRAVLESVQATLARSESLRPGIAATADRYRELLREQYVALVTDLFGTRATAPASSPADVPSHGVARP